MRKVPSALEAEIAGEKAAALGRCGRRLRAALEKLTKFDSGALGSGAAAHRKAGAGPRDAGPAARGGDSERRADLVAQAGDAYWSYVVQREAMGLVHNESIIEEYRIPPEVVRSMKPRLRKPQSRKPQ